MRDENVDIADLVWLQLIKDGTPKLYRWIEGYVASVAATSFGTTTISESGIESRLRSLSDVAGEHLGDIMYRHMFSELLPGVEPSFDKDGLPVKIHGKVSARDRQAAIDGRRLASPDHYRLYFSLIGPSHAITQAGFDNFWKAADKGPEETAKLLLELHGQMALGSLRKSDVMLERLRAMDATLWNGVRAKNVLLALGCMMDDAHRRDPSEESFLVSSWDRAERLIPILYANIADDERSAANQQLFSEGPAIGWLTSILRTEIFSHGLWGTQKRSPEEWLIPATEFAQACDLMLSRYRSMSMDEILATPRALHILFAWNQAGDEVGPRALIAKAAETDEGLLNVLSAFTSSVNSSDQGRYNVLKAENVQPFADYEEIRTRLDSIASNGPTDLRDNAKRLLHLADAARDF